MKHAYFMLPLEPARTVRRVQTMCKRSTAPTALAWPGESTITCPDCARKVKPLLAELDLLYRQLANNPDAQAKAKHNVDRVRSVIPKNIDTLVQMPTTHHRAWPFKAPSEPQRHPALYGQLTYLSRPFWLYRDTVTGAYGYCLDGTLPAEDAWFTEYSETVAMAKQAIDTNILKEQDHE